tara:strand:- start:2231 stop:2917 length:687 start_codon:yes stop_codon:yes gene_type:complete
MVSAPAITQWPRCTGDGNFGTMWGPSDVTKAKYTIDLCDAEINGKPNTEFTAFSKIIDMIDDKLLDFVHANQLPLLGRKNLSKEEIKMLQIRSVRPKYDKHTGGLNGHTLNLSSSKYAWDGMGSKYERRITICDHQGKAIPNGAVAPGDVVALTMYANMVYTGVGGDKFGIHWSFQDVSVVCQRAHLEHTTEVTAFTNATWDFSKPYVDQVSEIHTIPDVTTSEACAA